MRFAYTPLILLVTLGACLADLEVKQYKTPQIYSMHIHSDITYRYSTTKVTSRIKNPGEQAREALFDVTLPNEAFITNLTIEIDGNITVGEIKEKEVAKKQYQDARERGESAGYIGTRHRETNKFVLAISVAPVSKISFNLTYQELLKRKLGYYEHVIFIDPGQTVEDLDVSVSIVESRNITKLRVPPIRNDVGDSVSEVDSIVAVSQPTPNTALVRYAPTVQQQLQQSENGIVGRFVVQYDVQRGLDVGDVMMVNGYFVHFFAPDGLQPMPNDVLFILDVSGSMDGAKLRQLKEAMLSNLQQLLPGDSFNIMAFSSYSKIWRPKRANVSDEDAMEDAKNYIKRLKAGGWTNINSALEEGLEFLAGQLSQETDDKLPIIVFLTDGEPTGGETDTNKILANVARHNEGAIPIFTLAFGQDADWNFVKKLALQNNGFGRKIYQASDAALQITGFYNEISVTLLSNITFHYVDDETANVTDTHFSQYFNGSELTVCGLFEDRPTDVNVSVSFKSAGGSERIVLTGEFGEEIFGDVGNLTENKNYEEITEKVWAYLTIKQLLEKETVAPTKIEALRLKREVLRLSLKYGFVTPLTSMVVTQYEESPNEAVLQFDEAESPMSDAVPALFLSGHRTGISHNNRNRMSGVFGKSAYPAYTVAISAINPVSLSSKFNSRKRPRTKSQRRKAYKKRGKGKRNRNKQQRGLKQRFPLVAYFTGINELLCFNLYNPELKNKMGIYRLHSSDNNEVQMNVVMYSLHSGRNKRRGAIKEIQIYAPGDEQFVLNRQTMRSGVVVSSSHVNITQVRARSVLVTMGRANYNVTYSDTHDELYVSARQDSSSTSDDGLLGQLFGVKITSANFTTRNRKWIFNAIDQQGKGSQYTAMHMQFTDGTGNQGWCLVLRKKTESLLCDMADARV